MYKSLTFHRRGWHQGWRGCCPCPPGSALGHWKSVGCSVQRTSVSLGWCPGGPGSPHTGRWCDRLPVDSSLDPCSPQGHLTRSNESHTLSLNNSLDIWQKKLSIDIWVIETLFILTVVLIHDWSCAIYDSSWRTFQHLEHCLWFFICNLDEIKQTEKDAVQCTLLYWSGSLDSLPFALRGLSCQMGDKNKPCCQESVKSPAAPVFASESPMVSAQWWGDKQPLHK